MARPSRTHFKTHIDTNSHTADERQRSAWIRCGKEMEHLQDEIRDKAKELAGLRKRFKRITAELIAAATEDRLPLFEAK
jgi:hypothetical protein